MRRAFDPYIYMQAKENKLNEFFYKNGIDSIVMGISGGIDSAVVYKLMQQTSIRRVHPLFIPIFCKGTTGQDAARTRACKLITDGGGSFYEVDLSTAFDHMFD